MNPDRVRTLLSERIHSLVPDDHSAHLRDESPAMLRARALCGQHGRVVPTRQGLCPRCAGYVLSAEEAGRLRRAALMLAANGLWDGANIDRIRAWAFYHPQPHL